MCERESMIGATEPLLAQERVSTKIGLLLEGGIFYLTQCQSLTTLGVLIAVRAPGRVP